MRLALLFTALVLLSLVASSMDNAIEVNGLAAPIYFDIKTTKFSLVGEHNNTVAIVMRNVREDLYDVTIKLDMPSPLVVLGGNRWWFSSVLKGQTVTIVPVIFAPKSAVGSSFSAILEANYKELGQVFFTSETHSLGFAVYGYIKMIVYGLSIEPQIVGPGSSITVSGNVLNQGNVPAMFTNVTIMPKRPFVVRSDGVSYLGQVDPNSPAPFSLTTALDPETKPGDYTVTLLVTYQDDRLLPQSYSTSGTIQVSTVVERPTRAVGTPRTQGGEGAALKIPEWAYVVVAVLVAILLLYVRSRRSRARAQTTLQPSLQGAAFHAQCKGWRALGRFFAGHCQLGLSQR